MYAAKSMSSKPTIDRRPGIAMPAWRAACIRSTAVVSEAAKVAVGEPSSNPVKIRWPSSKLGSGSWSVMWTCIRSPTPRSRMTCSYRSIRNRPSNVRASETQMTPRCPSSQRDSGADDPSRALARSATGGCSR